MKWLILWVWLEAGTTIRNMPMTEGWYSKAAYADLAGCEEARQRAVEKHGQSVRATCSLADAPLPSPLAMLRGTPG